MDWLSETFLLNGMIVLGILFIVYGIARQFTPFIRWDITLMNSLKGTKTNITDVTIKSAKIGGIVGILCGIAIIVLRYWIFS